MLILITEVQHQRSMRTESCWLVTAMLALGWESSAEQPPTGNGGTGSSANAGAGGSASSSGGAMSSSSGGSAGGGLASGGSSNGGSSSSTGGSGNGGSGSSGNGGSAGSSTNGGSGGATASGVGRAVARRPEVAAAAPVAWRTRVRAGSPAEHGRLRPRLRQSHQSVPDTSARLPALERSTRRRRSARIKWRSTTRQGQPLTPEPSTTSVSLRVVERNALAMLRNTQVISPLLQQMWDEGPPPTTRTGSCYQMHGHFINMTDPSVTKVACGFYTTPSGDVRAIQNFSN